LENSRIYYTYGRPPESSFTRACVVTAAVFAILFTALFNINLAPVVSHFLTAKFETKISIASADLNLPFNMELKDISVADKVSLNPVKIEFASLGISPLKLLKSSSPVSSLAFSGSKFHLEGNSDGSFAIAGTAQAGLLFKLLSIFQPSQAKILSLKATLSTPLLPEEREMVGDLTFQRQGNCEKATYITKAILSNDELLLQGRGSLHPEEGYGEISLSLQTREGKTTIASGTTGATKAKFRYDAKVILATENCELKVTLDNGSVNLKPLVLKLPFLDGREILCEYAELTQKPSLTVKRSLFRTGNTSFLYEGPLEPSRENSGIITLTPSSLGSFLDIIGKSQKLPPLLTKALIEGTFEIKDKSLADLKGELSLTIPTNEIEGIDVPTQLHATVAIKDSEIRFTNGMVSGSAISDSWEGIIDLKSMIAKLKIPQIFGKTDLLTPLMKNKMLSKLSGDLIGSANIVVPINEPQLTSGRIRLEAQGNGRNHELFPLKSLTGLPLIVDSGGVVFDFNQDYIKIRELKALGQNFDYIDLRGEYDLTKRLAIADFAVAGLSQEATGFKALTGSISTADIRKGTSISSDSSPDDSQNQCPDTISFNLLCAGNKSMNCKSNNNGTHTLTWKSGDVEAALTGVISLNDILNRTPDGKVFEVSARKGHHSFNGHTRISIDNEFVSLNLLDGQFVSHILTGDLAEESLVTFDNGQIRVGNLKLNNLSGGTIEISGQGNIDKINKASIRLSDFLLATNDMPELRISGSFWIDSVKGLQSSHTAHSALVLIPEDRNLGLKAMTIIANLDNDRLTISKMKVRTNRGSMNLEGDIPLYASMDKLSVKLGEGKCNLSLITNNFDIGHLSSFFKKAIIGKGLIDGSMKLTGTTEKPSLSGSITGSEGIISLPDKLGELEKLKFEANLKDDKLILKGLEGNWNKELSFSNRETTFANISLAPSFKVDILSTGTTLSKEGLNINGLNFAGGFSEEGLKGTLSALELIYKATSSSTDSESALREYLISAKPIIEPSFPLNISIAIPKALHLRNSSFDAEFGGTITINKPRDGHAACGGAFNLLRGNFYLQGQRFKLQKGQLAFRRDPGFEFEGVVLPLPLPEMYIKGESNFSGITANMTLAGNPLVKNGMRASLDSERTDHTQGDIFGLFTARKTSEQNLAPPILNELGYKLLAGPLENTLGKVLPFDTIRLGGNLTLNDNYIPTILMGKYIGNEVHVNIEGGVGAVDEFLQQFAVDFSPGGSNMKLSFAKDLSGNDAGNTTMAFDYSIRF
jgi:hypothetical protein